ncbi:helix-turn-helix transcriptional regulator [uncultured Thermanaerothrix sp.]|uniref:helix-turn-helix domain-containing protein n=1 Tax=uncultured Thermanaerothrix sp. TaxID=1195149 RepID=UPI00260DF09D|nr:helix-turn-helix transcriptional regulator [uncultured Thermanaerothrix sp.]
MDTLFEQRIRLRAKKLGLLLRDARLARHRSTALCAQAIGCSVEEYEAMEAGQLAPSLPQLEVLALYLDIPLEHFWGNRVLSETAPPLPLENLPTLLGLRQRMIGTYLRLARQQRNLTQGELARRVGLDEGTLEQYETGARPIPLPELELIANALDLRLEDLFDQRGPVGEWRLRRQAVQQFLELPEELQAFIRKPVNRPYLELAMRLSELSADKLRAVAESLLEITY